MRNDEIIKAVEEVEEKIAEDAHIIAVRFPVKVRGDELARIRLSGQGDDLLMLWSGITVRICKKLGIKSIDELSTMAAELAIKTLANALTNPEADG